MSMPQIIQKENGDFKVMVHCKKMTRVHIYYDCPFCYTLKKNNRTGYRRVISRDEQVRKNYKSAKPTVHHHGTANNYNNGLRGGTCSHCQFDKSDVIMVIDDNTIKQL
tara:strand:+ start:5799 stop:6122 length:324 start_codon:yes stop_codon:yes gene_type:complete